MKECSIKTAYLNFEFGMPEKRAITEPILDEVNFEKLLQLSGLAGV